MLAAGPLSRIGDAALTYPRIIVLLAVRIAALLGVMPALLTGRCVVLSLAVVFGTTVLLNLRSSYGMDGSDQMATHVYGALLRGFIPGTSVALRLR